MDRVLGIDIGGTSIKVGLFSTEGVLEAVTKIPTGEIVSEAAFAVVTTGLKRLLADNGASPEDVIAIGLDVPGPVDDDGKVGMLANIELDPDGLKAAILRSFPRANLAFVNDANAAALGELWQGTAKGANSFVLVAIGTGVGGGVVANGKLISGAFGAGGEIGHITVNRDETDACGCGRKGCLEQYASAKGIVNSYLAICEELGTEPVHLDGPTDTLSIFNAHRAGDKAAKKAINKMVDYLGYALAQISLVVDPQVYLIGGGVGGGFNLYSEDLRTAYRSYCLAPSASTRILPASLGNDAAMYGCAFQALSER
ncbi:MAG: ROK family protein [Coriobacteriales bacterium]|jgi:glucokinase|nr:ROK family protein [Coriobacteriales bacterium]MDO5708876.1 ROK family protein [Coriobacteriales bacterium]